MIDRIEIFVTALSARLQRIFSSGSYDTGPAERLLGKPVLVKIYADGVVGSRADPPDQPGPLRRRHDAERRRRDQGDLRAGAHRQVDLRHRGDQRDVRQPARRQSGGARGARHRGARRAWARR